MPLFLLVISFLGIYAPQLMDISSSEDKKSKYTKVYLDEKNHKMSSETGSTYAWEDNAYSLAVRKQENIVDEVEGVLIRTCKAIHTLSVYNRCTDDSSTDNVWGFVGSPGSKGDLKMIWRGVKNSIFSCSNRDEYGRKLVSDAIPYHKIVYSENGIIKTLTYDFKDMGTVHADPCAYIDFVGKY